MKSYYFLFLIILCPFSCNKTVKQKDEFITISVADYKDKLKGFWLGQCIANMTGLVTEMDKIGEVWFPYRGAASLLLWHFYNKVKIEKKCIRI